MRRELIDVSVVYTFLHKGNPFLDGDLKE